MSLENALPLFIFLVISFLTFYFVETVILFALNWFLLRYSVMVVDKIMRVVTHYGSLIRMLAFGSIALIIALLFIFTPLADILISGSRALVMLALILLLTMILIYLIGSQTLCNVRLERQVHLYIFIILSLFAFTGTMSLANNSYELYEDAINQAFMGPLVQNIEIEYTRHLEDRVLNFVRRQLEQGKCEYYDYANKVGAGVTQFVFLKKDPLLAVENPEIRGKGEPLAGQICIQETKVLLTPEGKWYQVVEQ